MQTSQKHRSAGIHGFYHQPVQEIDPYGLSHIQILDKNMYSDAGSQGTSISFETCLGQFFTLESSSATAGFVVYDSPAASISSNRSPFSSQGSHSCISDPRHSPENIYGSPLSGSSSADDSNILRQKLRELEISLLGPESDITDSGSFCFVSGGYQAEPYASWDWKQMMEMIPSLDLKHVLGSHYMEKEIKDKWVHNSMLIIRFKISVMNNERHTILSIDTSQLAPTFRLALACVNEESISDAYNVFFL